MRSPFRASTSRSVAVFCTIASSAIRKRYWFAIHVIRGYLFPWKVLITLHSWLEVFYGKLVFSSGFVYLFQGRWRNCVVIVIIFSQKIKNSCFPLNLDQLSTCVVTR